LFQPYELENVKGSIEIMEFDCSKEVLTTEVVSKAYSEI
jgi:hypothetical protein